MKGKKISAPTAIDPEKVPRFLAYALPRAPRDNEPRVSTHDGFVLDDVPLCASVSFLDYDGIVLFAGAFERLEDPGFQPPSVVCVAQSDLDLREREFISAIQRDTPVIFLLPSLPTTVGYGEVDPHCDLYRRIAQKLGLQWQSRKQPSPLVESIVPEFKEYIKRFGTGYIEFGPRAEQEDAFKRLCGSANNTYGLVFAGKVFFLPCVIPQTQGQLQQIVAAAISSTLAYRKRMSSQMPAWVNEFVFSREQGLLAELEIIQKKALTLEGEIGRYGEFRGALCYQSDPLVSVVSKILHEFLGVTLTIDDKCIEDATLRNGKDEILAVIEIKGVKGNFGRNNVNQVDSHRERLGVPASTPGILIMNTLMDADCLADKDQPPHPDIIKKAAADGVLLIRTLDLLRYASTVEQGLLTKEQFRTTILTESGWLKVENGKAVIVRS